MAELPVAVILDPVPAQGGPVLRPEVERKCQLTQPQKIVALTHLQDGWMVKDVPEKFGVDGTTITRLKNKAANLREGEYAPKRKVGTG